MMRRSLKVDVKSGEVTILAMPVGWLPSHDFMCRPLDKPSSTCTSMSFNSLRAFRQPLIAAMASKQSVLRSVSSVARCARSTQVSRAAFRSFATSAVRSKEVAADAEFPNLRHVSRWHPGDQWQSQEGTDQGHRRHETHLRHYMHRWSTRRTSTRTRRNSCTHMDSTSFHACQNTFSSMSRLSYRLYSTNNIQIQRLEG